MSDGDVSRETSAPPVPEAARGAFPVSRLGVVERYAALLAGPGVARGLIGPREVPRLWERHLLNCAVLQEVLPSGASVCDVGSGAGLPGLVVAIARPDLRVTLVEPLLRRTTFLDEVVAELELPNVQVHRGRAESLHAIARFDVVTSRAVTRLDRLLEWSLPLVEPTGVLVCLKGRSVQEEIEEAEETLRAWGCATPEVLSLGEGLVSPPTVAVRVAWRDPSAISWPPTRAGAPSSSGRRSAPGPRRGSAAVRGSRPHRKQRRQHDG